MTKLRPVFIGGTGRSGTSIFKKVLDQHPAVVSIPSELRLIIDPGGGLDLIQAFSARWSPVMGDLAIRRFENLVQEIGGIGLRRRALDALMRLRLWPKWLSPRRYSLWHIGRDFGTDFYQQRMAKLVNTLTYYKSGGRWLGSPPYRFGSVIHESRAMEEVQIAALVARAFNDLYAQAPGAGRDTTHWVDDSPYNLMYAGPLLAAFEGSCFIHIYRDPRDVMASYITKIWGGDDFEATAKRLAALYEQWFRLREQLDPERFMELALEDLVKDPRGELACVGELAGFTFDEQLLGVSLDGANSGRWKKEIPKSELARAMPHLEPVIARYGYEI